MLLTLEEKQTTFEKANSKVKCGLDIVYRRATIEFGKKNSTNIIFIQKQAIITALHIYIYIVIYQNSSVWLDTQDARSRDRNPSNFTLDCDSGHSATKRTTLAKRILMSFSFENNASDEVKHYILASP